jgi:hypothetical protein
MTCLYGVFGNPQDLPQVRRGAEHAPPPLPVFQRGGLSTVARQGFDGFTIESNGVHKTLIADLDQAAVYGALNRIQPLDLDLIEVTRTGPGACVTESAGHIGAALARRYGPAVVLLEHHLAPELAQGAQTLDLVRFGAGRSPHWPRSGRPRRSIPVTPAWSYRWPPMATRSSVGRRDGPALARTRRTDRPLLPSI